MKDAKVSKSKKSTKISKKVEYVPIEVRHMQIDLIGVTPFLMNKLLLGINLKEMTPEQICDLKTHWINKDESRVGFPATGFLGCVQEAAKRFTTISGSGKGKTISSGVKIIPDYQNLIEVFYKNMEIFSEPAYNNNKGNAAIITHRPMFKDWRVTLNIHYVLDIIQDEQLINLIERAGYCIGIGSWCAANNGTFGQFYIDLKKIRINSLK